MIAVVESALLCAGIYLGIGAVVALVFVLFFAHRLDAAANGASVAFRPVISIGCLLLWPYMVLRILSARKINQPIEGEE